MAAKPGLLLFDDPTSGLDPITAATTDEQIVKLRDLEHVTSIVVTHQMRDAFYVASREAAHSTAGDARLGLTNRPAIMVYALHRFRWKTPCQRPRPFKERLHGQGRSCQRH